jgi:hypothetical protein
LETARVCGSCPIAKCAREDVSVRGLQPAGQPACRTGYALRVAPQPRSLPGVGRGVIAAGFPVRGEHGAINKVEIS